MKNRTKQYNRYKSIVKAKRKQKIARDIYSSAFWSGDYYNNLHQYSKNKIHCSCPECSPKTRNKGRRVKHCANYSRSINYKKQDLLTQLSMDDMEDDFFEEKKNKKRKIYY